MSAYTASFTSTHGLKSMCQDQHSVTFYRHCSQLLHSASQLNCPVIINDI